MQVITYNGDKSFFFVRIIFFCRLNVGCRQRNNVFILCELKQQKNVGKLFAKECESISESNHLS